MSALLEVAAVSKSYGALRALESVSFRVDSGDRFGLLGPNGAGKTTLLSILSCLLDPSGGEVRIAGRVVRPGDQAIRRLVGIVPQELAIYDALTARENLTFFGELFGLGGAMLRERVQRLLKAVGLDSRADSRAGIFSGGMKRRLNLAVSLVHGPQLLLLDEPTVGVDPQSRNLIFEEVQRLNREGLTIIYTTHYMEEVEALCNRVGIIDRGKLVACDTLDNLIRRMPGVVRVEVDGSADALIARLREVPGFAVTLADGGLDIAADDPRAALVRVVNLVQETNTPLAHLETREPNLERVFLHLTGRELRD
ncbi:MAG: ABC transporter ATP-binding protein [Planctomycetia bacterium]|nr:ABC transporter ATP-binding protein [Planctomycetia bacterium]